MQVTFSGANQEVTGSCYHLATSAGNVVVDCGMFQGGRYAEEQNAQAFPFDPVAVDALIVTHAHFDHVGRIPKLYREGFRGKIYCTPATNEIAMLTLRDSVHLLADEADRTGGEPLFGSEHVEPLEQLWQVIPYNTDFAPIPGMRVQFADAGHILGSASIRLEADGKSLIFSGDLGNGPVPLLRHAECFVGADAVICESTYGNRVHEPGQQREAFLRDAFVQNAKNRGVLLIPSFAVERTQEILFQLHQMHKRKEIPVVPVFLDAPLATNVTEVFRNHAELFNEEAKQVLGSDGDLFNIPGLHITETADQSRAIAEVPGPKVIIAGSGMMNGGRILHHLRHYLEFPTTTLLIVGFQVEGSLGRRLHQGEKRVRIHNQDVNVRAQVLSCGAYSGHADYPKLMQWLHCFQGQPPKHVYVTHGELNAALSFSASVQEEMQWESSVPSFGSSVSI